MSKSVKVIFEVFDEATFLLAKGNSGKTTLIDISDTEVEQEFKLLLMKIVATYSEFSSFN